MLPAAVVQVACGGDDDSGAAKVDSGPAADDASGDAKANGSKSDADDDDDDNDDCDKTKDFTKDIPDASVADGATSTGACIACTNENCGTFVKACNENCVCQGVAGGALTCFLQNPGNIYACAGELGDALADEKARNAALGIFTCVNAKCNSECALGEFLDGGNDAN